MHIEACFHTIADALTPSYGRGEAESMAKIVLEDAFGIRSSLRQGELPESAKSRLETDILPRLLAGEPLQYVLGKTMFYGYYFEVGPAVLIPRQETEELVAWALEGLKGNAFGTAPNILDIGTGSGCIPVVLAKKMPKSNVFAVDISPEALQIAHKNAAANNAKVNFQILDILDDMTWEGFHPAQFDMILSNPPYIPPSETKLMPPHVLHWEPHLALFAPEGDACIFYRKIVEFALLRLQPGGRLLFEVNEFRADAVEDILKQNGFVNIERRRDISGADRMVAAQLALRP
jgi:release factor glutamine methyltransferase